MTHLVVGLVLAGLGVWGIIAWWDVFGLVMRGVVPFTLLVVGLIAILSGYRKGLERSPVPAGPRSAEPPRTPEPPAAGT